MLCILKNFTIACTVCAFFRLGPGKPEEPKDSNFTNYTIKGYTFDAVCVFAFIYAAVVIQTPIVPTKDTSAKCYYAKGYGLVKIAQNTYKVLDGSSNNPLWGCVRINIVK